MDVAAGPVCTPGQGLDMVLGTPRRGREEEWALLAGIALGWGELWTEPC